MRARGSAHAERSTRTRFNKYKDEGSSSDAPAAPQPPDDDSADSVLAAVDATSDGGSDEEARAARAAKNRALDFYRLHDRLHFTITLLCVTRVFCDTKKDICIHMSI